MFVKGLQLTKSYISTIIHFLCKQVVTTSQNFPTSFRKFSDCGGNIHILVMGPVHCTQPVHRNDIVSLALVFPGFARLCCSLIGENHLNLYSFFFQSPVLRQLTRFIACFCVQWVKTVMAFLLLPTSSKICSEVGFPPNRASRQSHRRIARKQLAAGLRREARYKV